MQLKAAKDCRKEFYGDEYEKMNYASATRSLDFARAWQAAEPEFAQKLDGVKFNKVATWAYIVPVRVIEAGDVDDHVRSLMLELGAGEHTDAWARSAKQLWRAARGEAE